MISVDVFRLLPKICRKISMLSLKSIHSIVMRFSIRQLHRVVAARDTVRSTSLGFSFRKKAKKQGECRKNFFLDLATVPSDF